MRLVMHETRVPALAIAAYVNEQGAVYSSEILDRFSISEQALRRRRPELCRLGLVFISRGRGSVYLSPEFARRLPSASLPPIRFSERERPARRRRVAGGGTRAGGQVRFRAPWGP